MPEIELEKKAREALKTDGDPISEHGLRKLVVKYGRKAGITKKASCHSLGHAFATCKAERGTLQC